MLMDDYMTIAVSKMDAPFLVVDETRRYMARILWDLEREWMSTQAENNRAIKNLYERIDELEKEIAKLKDSKG